MAAMLSPDSIFTLVLLTTTSPPRCPEKRRTVIRVQAFGRQFKKLESVSNTTQETFRKDINTPPITKTAKQRDINI